MKKTNQTNNLLHLLGDEIKWYYEIPDRIVVRGYYPTLSQPHNIVYFFKTLHGVEVLDKAALCKRTDEYIKWVWGYARNNDLLIETCPRPKNSSDTRKEDYVLKAWARNRGRTGVYAILQGMEKGRTFVSRKPKKETGSGHRDIECKRQHFRHLYFYINDEVMGRMIMKVGTYLPFDLTFIMNGHEYVARRLMQEGIAFRRKDNLFLWVEDEEAFGAIVNELGEKIIQSRCDWWAYHLAPKFSRTDREKMNLHYRYSTHQMEYCCNLLFNHRRSMQRLMRRAIELGLLVVDSERVGVIFGRRITTVHRGQLITRLERKNEGFPAMRVIYKSSAVKLYDKEHALRVETIVNDPRHLKVNRHLANFPEMKDKMKKAASSYMDVMANAFDSHYDDKFFERLSMPTIRGRQRIPGVKLDDARAIRVMGVLLEMACSFNRFRLNDVYQKLLERHQLDRRQYTYNHFRYDCRKIKEKGILIRIPKSYTYTMEKTGIKTCTIFVKVRTKLLEPCMSPIKKLYPTPFRIEKAYRRIDNAFEALMKIIGLKMVA